MKRFRSKLTGFGFIVLAGSAVAADPQLLPTAPPSRSVVSAGAPSTDEPLVLPASVRFAAATVPVDAPDPIWLPAARPPSSSASAGSTDRPASVPQTVSEQLH